MRQGRRQKILGTCPVRALAYRGPTSIQQKQPRIFLSNTLISSPHGTAIRTPSSLGPVVGGRQLHWPACCLRSDSSTNLPLEDAESLVNLLNALDRRRQGETKEDGNGNEGGKEP